MTTDPEHFVTAGQALIQFGRWIQRTHPQPSVDGCQFSDEWPILGGLLPESSGLYVDIGAHHPIDCSNTINCYRRGWRGLLIEPLPDCLPNLLIERPRDMVCPIAASNREGYATMRLCRNISSLQPYWPNDAQQLMPVKTARLSTILAMYPDTDWRQTKFCSIDCEGHEREVLEGIDWVTFHPEVIMIEWADMQGNDISAPWMPILLAQNYREVHRNKLNLVLKRD